MNHYTDYLHVRSLMILLYVVYHRFQDYSSYVAASITPTSAFQESYISVLCTIFIQNHWLISQTTIVVTKVSSGSCSNDYRQSSEKLGRPSQESNQWHPFFTSCTQSTELWTLFTQKVRSRKVKKKEATFAEEPVMTFFNDCYNSQFEKAWNNL